MENCIFAKSSIKKSQAIKYMKTTRSMLLDISQATKGHTLVVPKRHVADIFEYDPELAGEVFRVCLRLLKH